MANKPTDRPDDEPGQPPSPRRDFQSLIDEQIAAAEARGLFGDLPGAGKPLDLDDDTHVPPEERAAYRMLKNAGFAPPWIELQQRIAAEQAELAAWRARIGAHWSAYGPASRKQLRTEYSTRLTELNRLITNFNLTAPPAVGQLALYRVADELAGLPE